VISGKSLWFSFFCFIYLFRSVLDNVLLCYLTDVIACVCVTYSGEEG